jgi:hypothetical protein
MTKPAMNATKMVLSLTALIVLSSNSSQPQLLIPQHPSAQAPEIALLK